MAPKKIFSEWTQAEVVSWLIRINLPGAEALTVYVSQSNIDAKTLLAYTPDDHVLFPILRKDHFGKILDKIKKEEEKSGKKKKKAFWSRNQSDAYDSGVDSESYQISQGKRKIHVQDDSSSPCSSRDTSGSATFGISSGGSTHWQTGAPIQPYEEHDKRDIVEDVYNNPEDVFSLKPQVADADNDYLIPIELEQKAELSPSTRPCRPVPELPNRNSIYVMPDNVHVYPTLSDTRIQLSRDSPLPEIIPDDLPEDMYVNQDESGLYINHEPEVDLPLPPPVDDIFLHPADEWNEADQPIYMNNEPSGPSSGDEEAPNEENIDRVDISRRLTLAMAKLGKLQETESTYLNRPTSLSHESTRPPIQPPAGEAPFFPKGRSPLKVPDKPTRNSPSVPREGVPDRSIRNPPPLTREGVPDRSIRNPPPLPRENVRATPALQVDVPQLHPYEHKRSSVTEMTPFAPKLDVPPGLKRNITSPNAMVKSSNPSSPRPPHPISPKPQLNQPVSHYPAAPDSEDKPGNLVKGMLAKFNVQQDKSTSEKPAKNVLEDSEQPQSIKERSSRLGEIPFKGNPAAVPSKRSRDPIPTEPTKPILRPTKPVPAVPGESKPPQGIKPTPPHINIKPSPPPFNRSAMPPPPTRKAMSPPSGRIAMAPPLPPTPIPIIKQGLPGMYEDVQINFPPSPNNRPPLPPPPAEEEDDNLYQLEPEDPGLYTDSAEWFPGYMPACDGRETARRILVADERPQCFLVRDSDRDPKYPHVISMKYNGTYDHTRVGLRPNGKYAIGVPKENEISHNSLGGLIYYHTTTPLNLVGRLIKLKNPVRQ